MHRESLPYLTDGVVDLVRTSVVPDNIISTGGSKTDGGNVQVFALEPDRGATRMFRELFGLIQVRWPVHVAVQILPLFLELGILHRGVVCLLELYQAVPERLWYILTAELTKARRKDVLVGRVRRDSVLHTRPRACRRRAVGRRGSLWRLTLQTDLAAVLLHLLCDLDLGCRLDD